MKLLEEKKAIENYLELKYEAKPSKGFKYGWLTSGTKFSPTYYMEFKSQTDIYEVRFWYEEKGVRLVILKSIENRII